MFKTIGSGEGSCREVAEYLLAGDKADASRGARLQAYLAGDRSASRAQAFGTSPTLSGDQLTWHVEMRETRRAWGKDEPPEGYRGRSWRSYYHWVISPPKDDHASADEMALFARRWLEEAWPSADGWQWVYSVHDDNGSRIMHVHMVMNAVNELTGRKAQISNRRNDELADIAQRVAGEMGMGVLPSLAERRRRLRSGAEPETAQWSRASKAEEEMRRRGARSWVAEVRDEVDRAVGSCSSFEEFKARLEHDGFRVEYSRRGMGFRHPESTGHDKKVMAARLGTDYSEEGIRARISFGFDDHLSAPVAAPVRRGADTPMALLRRRGLALPRPKGSSDVGEWMLRQMAVSPRRRAERMQSVVDAVSVSRAEGIGTAAELRGLLSSVEAEVAALEREVAMDDEGITVAARALRLARRADDARAELASLPDGAWDADIRRRRNHLLETIMEADDYCRRSLAKADSFFASRGLSDSGHADKAAALVQELGDRVEKVRARSSEARGRLERLKGLEKTVEYVRGVRAIPARPRGGLPTSPSIDLDRSGRIRSGMPSDRARMMAWANERRAVESVKRMLAPRHPDIGHGDIRHSASGMRADRYTGMPTAVRPAAALGGGGRRWEPHPGEPPKAEPLGIQGIRTSKLERT